MTHRADQRRHSHSGAIRLMAFPILSAILLVVSISLEADPLIPRAQQREKAGDTEGAARLYAAWLQANAGAPGSARVFSSYFRLENEFLTLRDASLKFLVAGRGVPGAAEQFAAIGRLFELGGMIGEARDAYLSAYAEGAPDTTLVWAFLLSLQMHETDAMTKCLAGLKARGGAAEALLQVLADIEDGHTESAGTTLAGLADSSGDPDVVLKALWVMYARARAAEDQKGQADARARLSAAFPGAPETALVSSPGSAPAVLFPSPDVFVPGEAPGQAPPGPLTAPPGKVSVQAGSFQVKENADDLSAELSKRGFAPIQRLETIQGKDHYRVFAGVGLDPVQARELLAKLLQEGFNGILVTEK